MTCMMEPKKYFASFFFLDSNENRTILKMEEKDIEETIKTMNLSYLKFQSIKSKYVFI